MSIIPMLDSLATDNTDWKLIKIENFFDHYAENSNYNKRNVHYIDQ